MIQLEERRRVYDDEYWIIEELLDKVLLLISVQHGMNAKQLGTNNLCFTVSWNELIL